MNVKVFALVYLIGSAFILISCSSTPQSRIEENPMMYNQLPSEYKNAVREGRIEKGMPPEAVFLAWGKPYSISEKEDAHSKSLIWYYATRRFLRHSSYDYDPIYYPYYFYSPEPGCYIIDPEGYVQFIDNKVVSWEKHINEYQSKNFVINRLLD